MKPEVDWIRFMVLMEGQCEPGMSEYEVTEERVRLATIDPELWLDTADERDTGAEIAKAMSQWRETQQESELRFPCYPSDVKRWAESQFLDVGQELEDACNDEMRERLRGEVQAASKAGKVAITGAKRGRPSLYSRFIPEVEAELQRQRGATPQEEPNRAKAIRVVVSKHHPEPDPTASPEVRRKAREERETLIQGITDSMKRYRQAQRST